MKFVLLVILDLKTENRFVRMNNSVHVVVWKWNAFRECLPSALASPLSLPFSSLLRVDVFRSAVQAVFVGWVFGRQMASSAS